MTGGGDVTDDFVEIPLGGEVDQEFGNTSVSATGLPTGLKLMTVAQLPKEDSLDDLYDIDLRPPATLVNEAFESLARASVLINLGELFDGVDESALRLLHSAIITILNQEQEFQKMFGDEYNPERAEQLACAAARLYEFRKSFLRVNPHTQTKLYDPVFYDQRFLLLVKKGRVARWLNSVSCKFFQTTTNKGLASAAKDAVLKAADNTSVNVGLDAISRDYEQRYPNMDSVISAVKFVVNAVLEWWRELDLGPLKSGAFSSKPAVADAEADTCREAQKWQSYRPSMMKAYG